MLCKIQCPKCGGALILPLEASGQVGRCSLCHVRFRVPDLSARLEDTAIGWICKSVDGHDPDDDHVAREYPPPKPARPATLPRHHVPTHMKVKSTSAQMRQPTEVKVDTVQSAAPVLPHLTYVGINPAGVKITFDSSLLKSADFRASLPMQCLGCGKTATNQLVAQPIMWIDKAFGRSSHQLHDHEANHRLHLRDRGSAREVVDLMPPLDQLLPPFNRAMPYFGCENCIEDLHVRGTIHADAAGIICEVIIPTGPYALAWIAAINGADAPEYAAVETTYRRLETGNWRTIPMKVRNRLAGWFEFQHDEQFLLYLPDSDYLSRDKGFGGVILTSDRLIFQKYSHHGSLHLTEPASLFVHNDDAFDDLSYQLPRQGRRDMVRLRHRHTEDLLESLSDVPHQLQVCLE